MIQISKNISYTFLLLAAFFMLPNFVSAAAPTISGVTGTVATGQTLTITGTNMVQENTTNWQSMFKTSAYGFEGSSFTSDGYAGAGGTGNCPACTATYDSSVKLMGSKSSKFHVEGASIADSSGQKGSSANVNESQGNYYIRAYFLYNNTGGSWPDTALKEFLFSGPACGLYIQPNTHSALCDPYTGLCGSFPNGGIENNRWYLVEIHYNSSSGIAEFWLDNNYVGSESSSGSNLVCAIHSLEFGIINTFTTSSGFALDNYFDGLTVSSSRVYPASTVEISNHATYGSGTKLYQQPVYLSDGSVQIKVNLSGLGSGPYYLYVTNNGQTTSAPYNLSGGGGGDTTAPAAPAGLRVQ